MDLLDFAPPLWDRNFLVFDEDQTETQLFSQCDPLVKTTAALNQSNAATIIAVVGSAACQAMEQYFKMTKLELELCAVVAFPGNMTDCSFSHLSANNNSCWILYRMLPPNNMVAEESLQIPECVLLCKQDVPQHLSRRAVKAVLCRNKFPVERLIILSSGMTHCEVLSSKNSLSNGPLTNVPEMIQGVPAAFFALSELHEIPCIIRQVAYNRRDLQSFFASFHGICKELLPFVPKTGLTCHVLSVNTSEIDKIVA